MKEKREINNRYTGQVQVSGEFNSLAELAIDNRAYLSGANLSGADLSGANLSGAYLYRADLYRADLSGADLSWAYLSWANLYGANLDRVNLSGANLSGANLSGADLDRVNLSGANLSGANLSGADLSGAKIGEFEMTGKFTQIIGVSEWHAPLLAYIAKDHGLRIMHGCRHYSIAEAHAHWKDRTDRVGTRVALAMVELWAASLEVKQNTRLIRRSARWWK